MLVGSITRSSFWEAAYEDCAVQFPPCRLEADSDSSRVFVSTTAHTNMRNNFVWHSDTQNGYSLNYVHTSGMTAVGDPICKSGMGYTPKTSCGAVDSKNWHGVDALRERNGTTEQIWVNYLNRADFNSAGAGWGLDIGDSGAVVYTGSGGVGWAGIAGPTVDGFYSRATKIEEDLLVSVCITWDCN